jgi:hypothetical protein
VASASPLIVTSPAPEEAVVNGAAIVMVAVFAIFATLSSLELKQLGVGRQSAPQASAAVEATNVAL